MKYFSIKELCKSNTAIKNKIDNHPTPQIEANLKTLIEQCLDPIREKYGKPITVTSGYRCPALNKAVGGKPTSQHLRGEAADLVGDTNAKTREIFEAARKLNNFDLLLYERNSRGSIWVHISYKQNGNRHLCLDNYTVK